MLTRFQELALLWRDFTWRHWRRAPGATILLVMLLALGVGTLYSIRLANRAAVAGFGLFTEQVAGESDFVITSLAGELKTSLLSEMRTAADPLPVALFPVLEATASEMKTDAGDGFEAEQFQIVGLDLVSLRNLVYLADAEAPAQADEVETELPQVFISVKLQERDGLATGDQLKVAINDRVLDLTIGGVLPVGEFETSQPANLLLMDLAELQRLTGRTDVIDRVEARLPPGQLADKWRQQAQVQLREAAGGRWRVDLPDTQRETGAKMTQAFRANLTIVSLLALLVGIYLIMQALEAAVARRRSEIAILRSLGVTPEGIRLAWMAEALSLGAIGTVVGLLLGWAGAQFSVQAVSRTVNALYFSNTTEAAAWNWQEAGLATVLGIGASVLAGWLPARDAARTPPASALQRASRGGTIQLLERPSIGLILLGVGAVTWFAPPVEVGFEGSRLPIGGYITALCWVFGGSILTWYCFPVLARIPRWGMELGYAVSQFRRPMGQHRLAGAGLVIAVGMAAAMSIMVGSFERTVVSWINDVLKADLYVAPRGIANSSSLNRIRPETWRDLVSRPEVADYHLAQQQMIQLGGRSVELMGAESSEQGVFPDTVVWVDRPSVEKEREFGEFVDHAWRICISETLSNRMDLKAGDRVELPTPDGEVTTEVIGVYADYGSERGSIVVPTRLFQKWFGTELAVSLSIYLADNANAENVRREWQAEFPGLVVRENREIRQSALRIFYQTFLVTHILKGIGLAVAVAGQSLAMINLLISRFRELATLKELGMTRRQIARASAFEGAGMGIAGTVVGLVLSVALGALLVFVINRQSFGWTLDFGMPVLELVVLAGAVIVASWIAGYVVGYRLARLPADELQREE